MTLSLIVFLAFFFLFIMSVVFHELGHAAVANWCGDSTARDLGRITLNPIAHIDLVWTILMPAVLFVLVNVPFGGAKPVPVVPSNFRNPKRDDRLVSLAGPVANIIQAFVYAGLFHLLFSGATDAEMRNNALASVLVGLVYVNFLLAAFNLLPIPPLDGSHIVASFLPQGLARAYRRIGFFGILFLLLLLQSGVCWQGFFATIKACFFLAGIDWKEALPLLHGLFSIPGQLGL